MTFLNASLIFAVAAIAVPIVLHLVARREPKKVVFPSIRFLTKKYESNRSKLQVRRWWLLALRIAALALLALALARPAIHQALSLTWLTIGITALVGVALLVMATLALSRRQSKSLTYGLTAAALVTLLAAIGWGAYTTASGQRPPIDNTSPAAIAIVLDNAPTSTWQTADDNRLDRIKDVSRWMISRLPPTSRIAIVDRSSVPATFALDASSAISKIDQLQSIQITQPIANRIDAAVRLVRTSELDNRQLLVITDLAESTWNETLVDPQLATTIAESPVVPVTLFDLGEFNAPNRSLSVPRLQDATPPSGVSVNVSTTLTLSGDATSQPQSVTAELLLFKNDPTLPVVRNGKVRYPTLSSVDRKNVQIAPGESREFILTIPPLTTGVHHGTIRLIGDDALALDDTRYFSLDVPQSSHLLLVSDDPEQADVIAGVISAPLLPDAPNAEYQIERIGFNDLPAVRMGDFDGVFLLDPPSATLRDDMLSQYTRQGGSIFVSLGPAAGAQPIRVDDLPVLLRPWRVPEPFTFLNVVQSSHSILAELNEIPGGIAWSDFRVEQYWQTETDDTDRVLMRFAGTKHPALIERLVASPNIDADKPSSPPGRWVIMTTPIPDLGVPATQWNDLFGSDSWPSFLLVRFIAEYITGRHSNSLMPTVGQPQLVTLSKPANEESETMRLQLFPPGETLPVPIDVASSSSDVVIADVSSSGTYWLRGASDGAGFSANLPSDRTGTERIDATSIDDWFGPGAYQIATNRDEVELAEVASSQSVSIRSPLMLLALAVFLLELILGNRFYRSSRNASPSAGQGVAAA
ncbi:MAG: BatA domain-containing protein [Pirellulaceae bacterium]